MPGGPEDRDNSSGARSQGSACRGAFSSTETPVRSARFAWTAQRKKMGGPLRCTTMRRKSGMSAPTTRPRSLVSATAGARRSNGNYRSFCEEEISPPFLTGLLAPVSGEGTGVSGALFLARARSGSMHAGIIGVGTVGFDEARIPASRCAECPLAPSLRCTQHCGNVDTPAEIGLRGQGPETTGRRPPAPLVDRAHRAGRCPPDSR